MDRNFRNIIPGLFDRNEIAADSQITGGLRFIRRTGIIGISSPDYLV